MLRFIASLFNSVMAGAFLACGVIVISALFSAGASTIGFTNVTYWYYVVCLAACVGMLVAYKEARDQAVLMGIFPVALITVLGVGFSTFANESGGGSQVDQLEAMLFGLGIVAAKGVMYVAPGLLTAFYASRVYLKSC